MPITKDEANAGLRALRDDLRKDGVREIPFTKPDLLKAFNAILLIWEGAAYRSAVNTAIESAIPGLTVAQKKRLHEAAMKMAIREGLL